MRRAGWSFVQLEPAECSNIPGDDDSDLVGSPKLFEPECRTPRQMQLANAFCGYLEMAITRDPSSMKNA